MNKNKSQIKKETELINIPRIDEKKYSKINNHVIWWRLGLLLILGIPLFLSSQKVSDIPIIFSMKDLDYENNTVEKVNIRTKYSGDVIYTLSISSDSKEKNSYTRMDITIYDCLSNENAIKEFQDEINNKNKTKNNLINLNLDESGIEESYSLFAVDVSPSNGQENFVFIRSLDRVVVIKMNNSLTFSRSDLSIISKLINVDLPI